MEALAAELAEKLSQVLQLKLNAQDLETPPDPSHGDLAFPCFKLSKERKQSPAQIASVAATQLQSILQNSGVTAHALGPYINFKVSADRIAREVLPQILAGEELGSFAQCPPQSRTVWIMEYSSPNVAKPFQIYHLRGTVLGASLRRIGKYRGHQMVGINHLGDWGSQFGKQAVAMQRYAQDLPAQPSIMDLVQLYVRFHQEAESNPALEEEAREAFVKLEQGDASITALWKKCIDISLSEFKRIYQRLGVDFDHYWGESIYLKEIPAMLEEFRNKKILQKSEGAEVIPVQDSQGKEIPPAIMVKKDGATIYATRDVAAARYRFKKFNFDRMTYIVGQEQKLHFQQIFAVLRLAGYDWHARCEHIPTGLYRFKDAKMSTRKGNFVTLEDVLDAAKERARSVVQDRAKDFSPQELDDLIEKVAIGAVVFNDLSTDPSRDVLFEVERIVDFDGETGPYLQYAHTRCLSVLRKAQWQKPQWQPSFSVLYQSPEEERLIKVLSLFPIVLEKVLHRCQPSQLSNYLIDVTKAFNAFYRECQILNDDPQIMQARLHLVESSRRILGRGLGLLGIPLPQRM